MAFAESGKSGGEQRPFATIGLGKDAQEAEAGAEAEFCLPWLEMAEILSDFFRSADPMQRNSSMTKHEFGTQLGIGPSCKSILQKDRWDP